MAEDAMNFLLQNLQSAVVDHYNLVSGAGRELELLEGELNSMTAFLKELEKQPAKGELLKQYEREVRDVTHEAQDILDECITRAALEKSSKSLTKYFNTKYRSLANQVKSFRRDTIKPLFDKYAIGKIDSSIPHISHSIATTLDHHNLQLTLPTEESIVRPKPEGQASTSKQFLDEDLKHETHTASKEDEFGTPRKFAVNEELELETSPRRGMVVGFEKDADTIIKLLCDEKSDQLEIISIIGMPGLGKTTLARKIYEDKKIKSQFPKLLIWVDVSQNYDKKKVFLSILKNITNEDTSKVDDDKLASTIKLYLQAQKFLLFLDDVWNSRDWEDIEAALPKTNNLGKVIITSRHRNVAVSANLKRNPHELGILDAAKSWELLQLQVFDNLNICPKDLEPLGRIIAHGCGGVPLAIVVIGGILLKIYSTTTGNERKNHWEKVSNSVLKYFNVKESRTRNIIGFSYNELSLDLRYCFLYLGIFPEESQIPVRRLLRMWIAEGFVWRKPNMNLSLEEVAYNNLKDLIDRNLVMVDNIKPDGYIKTCRVHDLIREFCKNEASLENHNLFQEMEMSTSEGTFDPPVSDIQNRRRICIHSHIEDFLNRQPKGPRVHSFLCFAKDAVSSLPANTSPIPPDFNRLRVLDVNPIKLTKFPSKLPELIHLRYIALSGDGDDFKALPKEISNLWNLQSIIIETKLQTFEIKANVWKMMHLRHLKTKAAIILQNKLKGKAGEALQSLSRLSAQCCTEGVFNKAKNLKNLGIRGDLASILEVNCFRELHLLEKLKLVYDISPRVASEKPLRDLPTSDRFPPNLRVLQLSGTFLPWNKILTLENLPALEVLKLKKNAFVGKHWPAVVGCFRSLEILVIADNHLVVWTAKESYFPKLECLVLKDCKKLEQIPFQLKENLRTLHVERVSESAVESAKKIAEEKQISGGFKLIAGVGGKSWK